MFSFKTFPVGLYEANCTIAVCGDDAYVIDPGAEADRIAAELKKLAAVPKAILLTHAHFDHIGAIPGLLHRYPGLPVVVHPADMPMFGHPFNALPPDYPSFPAPAGATGWHGIEGIEVIETPGHTPGGTCYFFRGEKTLLAGDTLFAGSAGRTDFPGGSATKLFESLKKLAALPDDTAVVPGHGPSTSIGEEKASNPFMLRA